jgi:hypothetical protein
MKGFIELHVKDGGDPFSININLIESISENTVVTPSCTEEYPPYSVSESYDEIKKLIEEAEK